MAGLGRYMIEVKGIAEELREYLHGELGSAAFSIASSLGERLFIMAAEEKQAALKFLSQTPSQRNKTLARLDDARAARLVLQARYLGLLGAQAMNLADELFYVPGMSYRNAAAHSARQALYRMKRPTMDEVLPGWAQDENGIPEPERW